MSKYFDATDVDLMEKIMEFIPDLDLVAYIAKLARGKLKYPIKDHDSLLPLFDAGTQTLNFKTQKIGFEQAKQFVPKSFFPIESEEQLIVRALIAFKRGELSHHTGKVPTNIVLSTGQLDPELIWLLRSPSATSFRMD